MPSKDDVLPAEQTGQRDLTVRTLWPFLVLSFGLTWGIAVLLVLFTDPIEAIFGELSHTHPLYILAVYSPAIAGILLVVRHLGVSGLGSFLRRLTLWRMPGIWWAFLLVGGPALFYLGAAITGNITDPFPFTPWHLVLPALAVILFIGPIEEFGWRGVALPLLQRRLAPLWAGLILGVIWAIWHVPAFLLAGTPHEAWGIAPFFLGVVALSVIMTPMFNASGGSLLIPILFHFQMNNPIWPDGHPWDMLLFVVAAVVVAALNRKTMLNRSTAVTDVLLSKDQDQSTDATTHPTHRA